MRLGPSTFHQCSQCSKIFRTLPRYFLRGGWIPFQGLYRTDGMGKVAIPPYPLYDNDIKCPHCEALLKLDEHPEVARPCQQPEACRIQDNPRIDCADCAWSVPFWRELSFQDRLQQMPDPETLNPDEEKNYRIWLWHLGNIKRNRTDTGHTNHKGDQKEVVPSYTKAEKANMHRLLSLLGKTPAELFQQAEIHRLNKRFGRAM